jgi:D-alanyl-D-alanine carboxypeptidase/D-alanyl-D-alanine-endopeptidase (penicillin-binding protein 4)
MQIAAAIGRHTGGAVATGEGTAAPGCACIARVASRPVGDLVREMLLMSDSDIAEVLARNTAIARGLDPTWESVGPAVTGAMRDAGFDMAGCAIADGSGLSRHNALRADLLTRVLRSACDAQGRADLRVIATALPEAGRTGTLRDQPGWFDGEQTSHAACRVRAKTGTLSDTCTLSGYVDHPDGRRSAFSLMANGVDGWAARAPVSALVAGLVS